jgi:hypothetical protein
MSGLVLLGAPMAAYGLPGEAAAVIQRCGTPDSENKAVSEVTNVMERDLTYGKIIMHFEPAEGGWTFRSAWDNHIPVTRNGLEARMPCFKEAMASVAAAPQQSVDPTIAEQSKVPAVPASGFGVPFLSLIAALAFVLILFVVAPTRRKLANREMDPNKRPYRRPLVKGFRFRRRKPNPNEI